MHYQNMSQTRVNVSMPGPVLIVIGNPAVSPGGSCKSPGMGLSSGA